MLYSACADYLKVWNLPANDFIDVIQIPTKKAVDLVDIGETVSMAFVYQNELMVIRANTRDINLDLEEPPSPSVPSEAKTSPLFRAGSKRRDEISSPPSGVGPL